jgi:hypothetical protein
MTPAEEEACVRSRWERVHIIDNQEMDDTDDLWYRIWIGSGDSRSEVFDHGSPTRAETIHAAYLFTVKRFAEIVDIEEEIQWLNWPSIVSASWDDPARRLKIIAREQAALAELLRGWKGKA